MYLLRCWWNLIISYLLNKCISFWMKLWRFFPLKLINITYTLKSARGVTIIFQKAHDLVFKKYLKNAFSSICYYFKNRFFWILRYLQMINFCFLKTLKQCWSLCDLIYIIIYFLRKPIWISEHSEYPGSSASRLCRFASSKRLRKTL